MKFKCSLLASSALLAASLGVGAAQAQTVNTIEELVVTGAQHCFPPA